MLEDRCQRGQRFPESKSNQDVRIITTKQYSQSPATMAA